MRILNLDEWTQAKVEAALREEAERLQLELERLQVGEVLVNIGHFIAGCAFGATVACMVLW